MSDRYFLYDNTCQARQSSADDGRTKQIYLTDFEQPLDLDAGQQSLRTKLIDSTFYGQTYQRRCHFYSKQGQYCLNRDFLPVKWKKNIKSGGVLRICDTEQDYRERA